jgi:hypothetical protein
MRNPASRVFGASNGTGRLVRRSIIPERPARTTKLCDRTKERLTQDEIEQIVM